MERGTLLAGRYEVRERLGHGGMGEVWSARDRLLRRDVALKLLWMDGDERPDLSARFEREAVAAAQINHPNVVGLYDLGVHEDELFLVMELVDGVPLSTLIDTSGVLTPHHALEIAEQICIALQATHGSGVVHYDIKPHNVMVTSAGVVKVVDFGIAGLVQARQLSVARSSLLAPAATVEYAAPEQLTSERADARSDLYALGGVLFAMLTGRAPFTGTRWAAIAAKMSGDAPRLEHVRPGLPPLLTDLVARLLERDPAHRPQSASEVRVLLAQLRDTLGAGVREGEQTPGTTLIEDGLSREHAAPGSDSPDAARPALSSRSEAKGGGPRQLPPDTGLFTGRESELQALLALVEQARAGGEPGTVVISAIDGMGGVGKTALAVRAGHRLAERYPDGQLFLDLYGFTQGTAPLDPGDALAALLGGLSVPPGQIPADLEARAAFYRDRMADTRTLLVLDNAADEAQVAPLLPASDTCLVLVTSRRRLKALDDALPLPLDVLPRREAVALLRKSARFITDPAEEPLLERAAELCGNLPLALLIAGALLRTGGKAWNLTMLIDRLAGRKPGDELAGYTDETRSLQAVFDLSYQHLPDELRLLFRCLGLLPGPEIDAYAAAALLDTDPDSSGRLLTRLADHSLLAGAAPGRYRLHDLVRAHTRTLAAAHDPEPERDAALERLLRYYAGVAQSASVPIARLPKPATPGPIPAYAPDVTSSSAARTWLRTEHLNLDAAWTQARSRALDEHTIALAAGLAEILSTDGPWTRGLEIQQAAADVAAFRDRPAARANALNDLGRLRYLSGDYPAAAETLAQALENYREIGNRHGEANALNNLGQVRYSTGDFPEAADAHTQALEIYRQIGSQLGEATALTDLGLVRYSNGHFPEAADAHTHALEIYRQIGNRHGEAGALNNLGLVRQLTRDFPEAADALAQALDIYREIGNRPGEAIALNNLGRVRQLTGDLAGAADAHTRALETFRRIGNRLGEANVLSDLGQAHHATGNLQEAVHAHTQALEIYRQIGHRGNEAYALNHYAATIAATGDRRRALALYQQALDMNRELDKPDDEAVSLEGIAEHHLAESDIRQGAAHLHRALEIYRRLDMHVDIERVQARLAEVTDSPTDPPADSGER